MNKKLLNIILILSLLAIPSGYIFNGIIRQIDGIHLLPRISLLLTPLVAIIVYAIGTAIGRKNNNTYNFFNIIMLLFIPCIFILTYLVVRDTLALVLTDATSLIEHILIRGGLNCIALLAFNESVIRFDLDENKIDKRNKIFIRNGKNGVIRYIYLTPNYEIWKIQQQKCGVTLAIGGMAILCQSIFLLRVNWYWLIASLILICVGYCRFGAIEQST